MSDYEYKERDGKVYRVLKEPSWDRFVFVLASFIIGGALLWWSAQ